MVYCLSDQFRCAGGQYLSQIGGAESGNCSTGLGVMAHCHRSACCQHHHPAQLTYSWSSSLRDTILEIPSDPIDTPYTVSADSTV